MCHEVLFRSWAEKVAYLDGTAREAASHPEITRIAEGLMHLSEAERAASILAFVQKLPRLVDPGPEEFSSPERVLARGDDCDGKAVLFTALARAAGLPARVRGVLPSALGAQGPGGHIQAEVIAAGRQLVAEVTERVPLGVSLVMR